MRIRTRSQHLLKTRTSPTSPAHSACFSRGRPMADRDGRLENCPRLIKAEVLPHDDYDIDQDAGGGWQRSCSSCVILSTNGPVFSLSGSQNPPADFRKEADCSSELPPPPGEGEAVEQQRGRLGKHPRSTRDPRKGREREGKGGIRKGEGGTGRRHPHPGRPQGQRVPAIRDWLIFKAEKQQTYKGTKGLEAPWRMIRAIPAGQRRAPVDNRWPNNHAGLF